MGRKLRLEKKYTMLGKEFEETYLGDPMGSLRQFRGPYCSHIREYADYYIIERDKVDPRRDWLGHLIEDAPDDLAGLVVGIPAGLYVANSIYEGRKNVSEDAVLEALVGGALSGLVTYAVTKWLFKK